MRHPSDDAPLVMDEVWWGYRPHWAKEKAPEPINATVEKVAASNYFRGAFVQYLLVELTPTRQSAPA